MQAHPSAVPGVLADLSSIRAELLLQGGIPGDLLRLTVWRPLSDGLISLLAIGTAMALVMGLGGWFAPVAALVIANRQRALGNLLHDAGHGNLHRSRVINDTLAAAWIAPLVFADLNAYRRAHLRHHLRLGAPDDPDRLETALPGSWVSHFVKQLLTPHHWWGSLLGHLVSRDVGLRGRLYIIGWWSIASTLLWSLAGGAAVWTCGALWMLSRGTAFHAITMFREMCDHYGLAQGGILSYTRDILHRSAWYRLIHPCNNGYHLTHHLLPTVPYYRLPQAQARVTMTSLYRARAQVCDGYLFGPRPAVARWSSEA